MIINRIQPTYNSYSPSFGDFNRVLFKTETGGRTIENIKRTCNTWGMRGCPDVGERADYIIKNGFKHIYDFGCSNAIDTMCLIIALDVKGGDNLLRKLAPIHAGDIDGGAQYYFENNKIYLQPEEMYRIDDFTNGKFLKYFESDYTPDMLRPGYWRFSPYYKSMIDYSLGNVLEDYKKIEPEKSFVQGRNFWPYLEPYEREFLAKSMLKQLGMSSRVCLGEFDKYRMDDGMTARECILKSGFVPDENSEYFYKKKV